MRESDWTSPWYVETEHPQKKDTSDTNVDRANAPETNAAKDIAHNLTIPGCLFEGYSIVRLTDFRL